MTIMTVGALRKALENVPDNLEVTVYSLEEHDPPDVDDETVCPLVTAEIQSDEEGNPFFALYASNCVDDEEEEEGEEPNN